MNSNPYFNPNPYIPASLVEIMDLLGSMISDAPTFIDRLGHFPRRTLETRSHQLTEGFGVGGKQLGEERYGALLDRTARAKALFAADQDDTNGKTDQGRDFLIETSRVDRVSKVG